MDFTKRDQRIISIGPGMRGLERGIERCGIKIKHLCYVEVETFIIENLVRQMEEGVLDEAPIWVDIKTFNAKPFRGLVDGIVSGYPCQPFSVAGKQLGTEDPRHLWPYIKDGIQAIRPVWCFFENVPGHVNIGYREVRSDLEGLGYKVEEGIFSAEEVGAPHQRKRLFILAIMWNATCDNQFRKWIGETIARWKSKTGRSCDAENTCCESIRDSKGGFYTSASHTSTKMEYSPEQRFSQSGSSTKLELSEEEGKRMDDRFEQSSNRTDPNVANSNEFGLWTQSNKKQPSELINKSNEWPTRPGQYQHQWEVPRIESSLGFTINGYNFREDLLRMAGNGVVEQTAEKAFMELLQKHINNGRSNPA